jgi:F0F1-type ATP synthase assembly protein I
MEQYYFPIIFFLIGFILGKLSMYKPLVTVKKENDTLKKETLLLKNHIVSTKKGRIIVQGEEKK